MPPKLNSPRAAPAKDWVFTIWPTEACDFEEIFQIIWALPYSYITFQIEVGTDVQPHVQGFVQFQDKLRLTALKKFHREAHWEKRRGTPYEAQHYCQKPVVDCTCDHCKGLDRFDINYEDGCISAQQQWKVHEIARSIKLTGLTRTIERFPEAYLSLSTGMERLSSFYLKPRDFQTQVTVVYGEPRAGKSRFAMLGPSPYKLATFSSANSVDFFGDYRPDVHETLVVDDFYSNWKYTTFLQVCDRYPTEVHTKGGFRQFLCRDVIFTSNLPPNEWYPNILADPDRAESFHGRIHNIIFVCKFGYKIMKGHLPWPFPHLPELTVDVLLMNPQIQHWMNLQRTPRQQRPDAEAFVQRPSAPHQQDNLVLQPSSQAVPFGPETYENFVARRTQHPGFNP